MTLVRTSRLLMQVHQAGAGHQDDVVLVAGLGDEGRSWERQLAGLSSSFRVTAFDNRGTGGTRAPAGPISTGQMALDLLALLDDLGIERAHLVGDSMGGAIAQEFVLAQPHRVASLVLSGTWCRSDRLFRDVIGSWRTASAEVSDDQVFLRQRLLWGLGPAAHNAGLADTLAEELGQPTGQTRDEFARQCDAVLGHDSSGGIHQLRLPVLVLHGEDDALVGARHARELTQLIPGALGQRIPGAGHSPALETPAEYTGALTSFWKGVTSASG